MMLQTKFLGGANDGNVESWIVSKIVSTLSAMKCLIPDSIIRTPTEAQNPWAWFKKKTGPTPGN